MSIERTAANKARQAKARERWLLKRQSQEIRERLLVSWYARHPDYLTKHPKMKSPTVKRFGIEVTLA